MAGRIDDQVQREPVRHIVLGWTVEQGLDARPLRTRLRQQAAQARVLARIHHAAVAGIGQPAGHHRPRLRARQRDELAHLRTRHQHVVRRDAGLPCIQQLARQHALDRVRQGVARRHDRRALAPQLQRDWR